MFEVFLTFIFCQMVRIIYQGRHVCRRGKSIYDEVVIFQEKSLSFLMWVTILC